MSLSLISLAFCCLSAKYRCSAAFLAALASSKLSKNPKYRGLLPTEATYGYAITTWKAQGSEFQKVLALEENFPFDREEHQKYLYTAVTRAKKSLIILGSIDSFNKSVKTLYATDRNTLMKNV